MTLHLSNGLPVRSGYGTAGVQIGDHDITMGDFLQAVMYVLTNTDLEHEDERLAFVGMVRGIEARSGFNPGGLRLVFPDSP